MKRTRENLHDTDETPLHALPRLYVRDDLSAGATLALESDQAHYLAHVLRLSLGDSLRIFNGRDGDWRARMESVNPKRGATISVLNQLVSQKPEPDIWLAIAPIKRHHFDFALQKAAELGAARIRPLLTDRTQVRALNAARCEAILCEAAEQSERLSVPLIDELQDVDHFLSDPGLKERVLLVCAESGDARPLADILLELRQKKLETNSKLSFCIVTGPEGGFTPRELEKLRAHGSSLPVRLGPRILRADTAALAALACVQAMCGDWDDTDTRRED